MAALASRAVNNSFPSYYRPQTKFEGRLCFQYFCLSTGGPPPPPWSRSRSGGGAWSRSGGPPGQGPSQCLGGPPGQGPSQGRGPPLVQVRGGPPWSRSRSGETPRSRSGGPPWSRFKNAGSAGGTPLAVTQEDCLVCFMLCKNRVIVIAISRSSSKFGGS